MPEMSEIIGPANEQKSPHRKAAPTQNNPSLSSTCLLKIHSIFRGIEKFDGLSLLGLSCAAAVVTVGCAVVATLGLGPAIKYAPTLFFCSVILSSRLGGVWLGALAVLLSAIALDYYFIPPIYSLGITLEEAPDMLAFVASALLVSWLSGEQVHAGSARRAWDGQDAKIHERIATSELNGQAPRPRQTVPVFGGCGESLTHSPTLCHKQESVFLRQGDYWTIQYQGQITHLRATRGLDCLASLLRRPGQEFHVSELVAGVHVAAVAYLPGDAYNEGASQVRTVRVKGAGPVLDARAKAEYACRIADLRKELEDAERLNDPARAGKARQEIDYIADQLAVAVGLGGRDRQAGSQTERARSAVTKRIKGSIDKIGKAMPALGRHLAASIKTGYFCSYRPNPDQPVAWRVRT